MTSPGFISLCSCSGEIRSAPGVFYSALVLMELNVLQNGFLFQFLKLKKKKKRTNLSKNFAARKKE